MTRSFSQHAPIKDPQPDQEEQHDLHKTTLVWETRVHPRTWHYSVELDSQRSQHSVLRREFSSRQCLSHDDTEESCLKEKHKDSNDTVRMSDVWTFFGRQTTFHGVKNVVSLERRPHSRFLWLLLVLAMSASMVYTVAILLLEYRQYNTVTRTDVKISESMTFPSVTLCNICPFRNHDGRTDTPLFKVFGQFFFRDMQPNMSDPETVAVLEMDVFEIQQKYANREEDLFIKAYYENVEFNVSEILETTETIYGRCFTFNGPEYVAKFGPRLARFDGRESGLRLLVQLHQKQYFAFGELTAGVRMFVAHPPDTPRLRQDGVDIHPGTSTRLALNPVQYTFLPAPYKSYGSEPCVSVQAQDLLHKMVNASFYSHDHCLEQCHNLRASLVCSCYTHLLYVPNLPRCNLSQVIYCFQKKRENMTVSDCDCPRSCTFVRYDVTMSASQLPSAVSTELLRHHVNMSSAAEFRDDFLEIRVYLDTMLLRHERHESQYTFSSVFAFLGGQMGFFIGASLVTLVEIMEAVVASGLVFIRKRVIQAGHVLVKVISPARVREANTTEVRPKMKSAW